MPDNLPTARQLDHWIRRGYIKLEVPHPGSGNPRVIPPSELKIAKTMVRLTRQGWSVAAAARMARNGK